MNTTNRKWIWIGGLVLLVGGGLWLNARALAALGMGTGLSHMEWFLRKDGSPVVSEVGARPPGAKRSLIVRK